MRQPQAKARKPVIIRRMEESAEARTLRAFVASPRRRERLVGVLTTKKRAPELDEALSHEDLWDPQHVVILPGDSQDSQYVATVLRELGAPSTCRILGGTHDGEEMDLDDALNEIVGSLDACLVICIPGHLAYHESEDPGCRLVLAMA